LADKPVDELYSVLGRIRQGKTERYRALAQHLDRSGELFVPAPGTRGMVMIVFTLAGHHLVVKVIRDRFAPPKKMTRERVVERYRLVARHDRVGRMIDTQAFRNLAFERAAFTPAVIDELAGEASASVRIEGGRVIFEHVYMERRVRPLNLYLPEVSPRRARDAVIDYGQAIREMALVNIFPGDMLLKNFGVTRHGRVVFYDFDEVALLTDCCFRALPRAPDDELELAPEVWFRVSENDVFPEQFRHFLGLAPDLLAVFLEHHADLLEPAFWRQAQALHAAAEDDQPR
jgi:isocitrate dehydrogenase kinase/phosphatase